MGTTRPRYELGESRRVPGAFPVGEGTERDVDRNRMEIRSDPGERRVMQSFSVLSTFLPFDFRDIEAENTTNTYREGERRTEEKKMGTGSNHTNLFFLSREKEKKKNWKKNDEIQGEREPAQGGKTRHFLSSPLSVSPCPRASIPEGESRCTTKMCPPPWEPISRKGWVGASA
mmetsp:Transcript_6060/g.14754  ORF Transcript_6060/g.14754 Transcript_6060/m.14754 type:complete len:173 (-) Transcript_6060:1975-2493(-)